MAMTVTDYLLMVSGKTVMPLPYCANTACKFLHGMAVAVTDYLILLPAKTVRQC